MGCDSQGEIEHRATGTEVNVKDPRKAEARGYFYKLRNAAEFQQTARREVRDCSKFSQAFRTSPDLGF